MCHHFLSPILDTTNRVNTAFPLRGAQLPILNFGLKESANRKEGT